jgi:hypothetical protein
MPSSLLFHLPEPVGWIALTPDALREAQTRASEAIGPRNVSDEPVRRSEPREHVTAQEAARALGVDASWLMRQARLRRVPFLKVGKYNRFDIDALRTHLAKGPAK